MIINKCDFLKDIFQNQDDRNTASKLIRRLPLVSSKIEKR